MPETCRHCGRGIVFEEGAWIDPEATGDDEVWREACGSHDTFTAEHEPEEEEEAGTIGADPFMPVLPPDPPKPRTLTDAQALDRLNYMLSAEEWSVSFLEDTCEIVRATGRTEIEGAEWASH